MHEPPPASRHILAVRVILLLCAAMVLAGCSAVDADAIAWAGIPAGESGPEASTTTPIRTITSLATASLAPSRTPFQPVTNTPTPTATATPTNTPTPTPTIPPTPTPEPIPEEAYVDGVTGYPQSLPLSCESRSAVDWARSFGVNIAELEFMYALPATLNPNTGFVGSPYGWWGQIPPGDYGVHAAPVAALLRSYGLNAWERTGMDYDDLRREIADGQPVIVWVVGSVSYGSPATYTAPDGETLTVAAREHTVMLTGYSPSAVRVQDGGMVYSVSVERFLDSWGVLENMAVIYED